MQSGPHPRRTEGGEPLDYPGGCREAPSDARHQERKIQKRIEVICLWRGNICPSDTPQLRLQDLMKEHKITQAELASKIGVAESSISRFLKGTKDKLTTEQIIRIARIFNVSSDFLLCLTNVPDKKNYDISELGAFR